MNQSQVNQNKFIMKSNRMRPFAQNYGLNKTEVIIKKQNVVLQIKRDKKH